MATREKTLQAIRETVRSIVRENKDLNKDGKNDFEDVMIARMKASGEDEEIAVKKGEKAAAAAKDKSQSKVTETKLTASLLRQLLNKELAESSRLGTLSELGTLSSSSDGNSSSGKKSGGDKKGDVGISGTGKMNPKQSEDINKILSQNPENVVQLATAMKALGAAGLLNKIEGIGVAEVKAIWKTVTSAVKGASGKENKISSSQANKAASALDVKK